MQDKGINKITQKWVIIYNGRKWAILIINKFEQNVNETSQPKSQYHFQRNRWIYLGTVWSKDIKE